MNLLSRMLRAKAAELTQRRDALESAAKDDFLGYLDGCRQELTRQDLRQKLDGEILKLTKAILAKFGREGGRS